MSFTRIGAPAEPVKSDDVAIAGIQVADLVVEFPGRNGALGARAVDGVTFDVRPGELLVLVGRSGCGKTTVLNVLAGLQLPTSGTALVAGDRPRLARRRVGYMFARDGLLPWRSARRNVEFALEIRRPQLSRSERRDRALAALERVGVVHAAGRYPWQLSQGMRQRVALARTWVMDPEVLLMDEPFAALDAQTRASVQEEFLGVWGRNRRTAVFVTHELKEAVLLADRILVLHTGRVIDEIAVGIERPRNEATLEEHPRYGEIHRRLIAGLNEMPR
ncbi:ABC transporter ATP-binding protein [Amycolatopsis sp. NPDC005232]|uniref:ABC transporter ATP-binding protein n=1 Tax=Amycolatopsis sp. NPDC005232 TaxID=3157027 RepID=UPI0033AD1A9D